MTATLAVGDWRLMQPLYDRARHEPLAGIAWSPARACDAIAAICRDAEAAFDAEGLWPLHPRDDEPGTPADGILRGVYVGAALLAAACLEGDAAFPGLEDL
jgi:hypothetical protein